MTDDVLAAAVTALESETTTSGLLRAVCLESCRVTTADACALSRIVGDLLVDIVNHARDGRDLELGRGYLLSDYPVTADVIERLEPRIVDGADPQADPAETALLRELGYATLLMVPLVLDGRAWGLVELYRYRGDEFDVPTVARVSALVTRAGQLLLELQRREADRRFPR